VSLFDDDTGEPLDFSGVVREKPGDYSNNLWLVTDGSIVTMSLSALTIPDYPIGGELAAVALTVDPDLAIAPGDPVTIANLPDGTEIIGPIGPPPSPYQTEPGVVPYIIETSAPTTLPTLPVAGNNSMTGYVTSYASATGKLVVQIGSTFQFEIRPLKQTSDFNYGYTGSWDWIGGVNDYGPLITGALGSGLSIVDVGVLQIRVPEKTFRKLNHRTYGAFLSMTDSYDTRQVFIARLPMQYGGLSL
jgi:hypothetical protein